MTPIRDLVVLVQSGWTLSELESFVRDREFRGYPIVMSKEDTILSGYILRNDLQAALGKFVMAEDEHC